MSVNPLNALTPREWIKFQKSWFVHNPPGRSEEVRLHPAKFPETLAEKFISFFTRPEASVLDPMAGTGSTLVAALRIGRHSYGVELNPVYAQITSRRLEHERRKLGLLALNITANIHTGDAARLPEMGLPSIDYVLTSPPYWDMLHARGGKNQKKRRETPGLDVVYSNDPADLGNIHDYETFLSRLIQVYATLKPLLRQNAYLTIIVKNVKKKGRLYPLAWDIGRELGRIYALKDEKIWCQDNQQLFPFGFNSAWVSNTLHHYCLQFRNE